MQRLNKHDAVDPAWRRALRYGVPVVVSSGLLAYILIVQVPPSVLWEKLQQLDYARLVPWALMMVVALYLWDGVCMRFVFGRAQPGLGYRSVLRARGVSYLALAFNYELGQGIFAWTLARQTQTSLLAGLARIVLVSYHDAVVLLGIGLVGSLFTAGEVGDSAFLVCAVGLAGCGVVALTVGLLPSRWRAALQRRKWGAWSGMWSWKATGILTLLRLGYYGYILIYAAGGFYICDLPHEAGVVASVVPIVLIVDALPISISGLGTREVTLLKLLDPENEAVVVAFSFVWSAVLILGRALIGTVFWLFVRGRLSRSQESQEAQGHSAEKH
jgi:hypothetical protein